MLVANLESAQTRYRDLLQRATDPAQVLGIERELERVRTDLDRVKSRLAYLQNRVAYATIAIGFVAPAPAQDVTDFSMVIPFTYAGVSAVYAYEPPAQLQPQEQFKFTTYFVIGKGEDSDVKLSGWSASRKVAVIFRDESGFRLIDVTHKGGAVYVNGKVIDDVRLGDNDELKVRGKPMKFMRGTPVR